MSHAYITYFDINYAVKGLAMIESLSRHDPGCSITVICMDDETFRLLAELHWDGVRPVPLKLVESGDKALAEAKTNRSRVEYYWTMTPTVILKFLSAMEPNATLTYVDADLLFFSSPDPVYAELGTTSVLIHKHNFPPRHEVELANGIYNVGLMVFRHDADGLNVLRWWRERCLEWCYARCEDGKMGDQKYLESFHTLTDKLTVAENPGVGVAPWNFTGYQLEEREGVPCVNGSPTIFFHYHSAAYLAPGCLAPCTDLTYLVTLDMLRLFAVPYLNALNQSLQRVRQNRPNFSAGFQTDDLNSYMCMVVHKTQTDAFRTDYPCILLLDDAHHVCVAPQLAEYNRLCCSNAEAEQAAPETQSLDQAIGTYQRFPAKPRLLNLGCGHHMHPDWLNVDINPSHPAVIDMDLRQAWPLPVNFFDVVYHSHVLEHMSQQEGLSFLRKCFDVLKPGGILRVAIPDLAGIARHYLTALEEAQRGDEGAADRHTWMVLELVDQTSRHHSGGAMAEYFKQSPLPQKDFVLSRIGWEGEQLIQALQGLPPSTEEEHNPATVGAFRLEGEVHRWMYDAFSLQQALEAAGFTQAHVLPATESAYPGFADFDLDADAQGKTRKPDSLFMEARKPASVTTSEPAPVPQPDAQPQSAHPGGANLHPGETQNGAIQTDAPPMTHEKACRECILAGNQIWEGNYPDWQSAVEKAGGYDEEGIFQTVRDSCRAVRDGKALWERDSVLFSHPEYNWPLLGALMTVAANHQGKLHVLDFGGSLGSSYMQHRAAFAGLAECTWHVVEQEHFIRCGKAEFTTPSLMFHSTPEEALAAAPINVILLSSVLQYMEDSYGLLKSMIATKRPILLDRTPLYPDGDRITVQMVPADIYQASYACRWLDKRRIEGLLGAAGYTLSPWFPSAVDPAGFYGMLALPR